MVGISTVFILEEGQDWYLGGDIMGILGGAGNVVFIDPVIVKWVC